MTYKPLPDQEQILKDLDYDPDTGKLTWLPRPKEDFATSQAYGTWNARFAGRPALNRPTPEGYLRGRYRYDVYTAHRIIWKLMTGEEPVEIDHINGVRADNRIANLRSVSVSENRKNMRISSMNTSGISGVSETSCGWTARICINTKAIWLGCYKTRDEAVAARIAAEKVSGFHPNHGRNTDHYGNLVR